MVIENDLLRISILEKGAELTSIFHHGNQLEYMWQGDPAVWGKHSPILFPIVGTLKNDLYQFREKQYSLPRHGFAREQVFEVKEASMSRVMMRLVESPSSLKSFPFQFELTITYQLNLNELQVEYSVTTKSEEMFFSIGGHPAFKVPLVPSTHYEDYFLLFNHAETAPRWPVTREGLIGTIPLPLMNNERRLPLKKELFHHDAVVLKNLNSDTVALRSDRTPHGLDFIFKGFPYLGIWAAKGADFVCIEPWCGIADSETPKSFEDKEGIIRLKKEEKFTRQWSVQVY